MKMPVYVYDITSPEGDETLLGEMEFNTADHATFLVAPWFKDSHTPTLLIPEGYNIVSFRYFAHENSISINIAKGKLVPNEQ